MGAYNVLSTIRHDGIVYEAGQVLTDIEEVAAKELVKLGVVAQQDGEELAHEAGADAEQVASEAADDPESLAAQAEDDIKETLKQNEELAAQPGQPVTTGSPTPEEVAATAAQVE